MSMCGHWQSLAPSRLTLAHSNALQLHTSARVYLRQVHDTNKTVANLIDNYANVHPFTRLGTQGGHNGGPEFGKEGEGPHGHTPACAPPLLVEQLA